MFCLCLCLRLWRPTERRRQYLKIYYLGIDARPELISVSQDLMRDDVSEICKYINEVKSKNLASNF